MDATELRRDCEAIAIPSGTRQTLRQGTPVRIMQTRGGSFTVGTDVFAMYRIDGADADALGLAQPQADGSRQPQGPLTEELVWDTLKTVFDPELPVNIVDLGLVYSCAITDSANGGKTITIQMAMTSPGCGMSNVLKADVESRLSRLPEVTEARVEVVFDPPWNPSRMSEGARMQLGLELESSPNLVRITRGS